MINRIIANVNKVIVGKEETVKLLLTAMLASGHVLIEDMPGSGKTKLAKALSKSISLDFSRIQFTPDLLPTDITGLNIFNKEKNEFELKKGPVFTNILLADEINRATPRTQAGLLEAMEEKQGVILMTADHGNAEQMIDYKTGEPHTAHTTNPVPLVLIGMQGVKLKEGKLADLAPTMLDIIGLEKPKEMTGNSLIEK